MTFDHGGVETKKTVRAARKALAEKAKAEKDAARAAEKETKRREQRDAKQLQAMCNSKRPGLSGIFPSTFAYDRRHSKVES